jgi:Domain of unknown function (DUF4124)
VARRESIERRSAEAPAKALSYPFDHRFDPSVRAIAQTIASRPPEALLHQALLVALLLATLLTTLRPATATAGTVVKCDAGAGRVIYQDTPCPPGKALRDLELDPATVSVIPDRPIPGTTTRATAPVSTKARGGGSGKATAKRGGDPAERKYLHPGMLEGEVLARAGPPDMKTGGGSRKHARWTYMPVPADAQTLTSVLFDGGRVIEVERKVVK